MNGFIVEGKWKQMRDLRPGDIVHVQGIICEIAEIAWQEPWKWREACWMKNNF